MSLRTSQMFGSPAVQQPNSIGVSVQGRLYAVLGGFHCGSVSQQVGTSVDGGVTWSWVKITSGFDVDNYPSVGAAVINWKGTVLAFGGTTCGVGYWSYVWQMTSIDGSTWTRYSPATGFAARAGHFAIVDTSGERVYIMGGGGNWDKRIFTSTNPTQSWSPLPDPVWAGVGITAATMTPSNRVLVQTTIGQLYISNVEVKAWQLISPANPWFGLRAASSLLTLNGNIWALGGKMAGSSTVYRSDVWVSTDEGGSWMQVTPDAGFTPRSSAHAIAVGNSIVLFGGVNRTATHMTDVWRGFV
jgi:hypothetical protein